jgi:hypothetical protein
MERKLKQIIERTEASWSKDLSANRKDLSLHIAELIHRGEHNRDDMHEILDRLRETARVFDAATYLRETVLAATHGRVVDIPVDQDFGKLQDSIFEVVDGDKSLQRGFVYVAWARRPEQFYYVGKAPSGVDRLNLRSHGTLARATSAGYATVLSLIYPSQSRPEIVANVEAATMMIIRADTDELPQFNEKQERVPASVGSNHIDSVARALSAIVNAMSK